jgi:hypothetical protein
MSVGEDVAVENVATENEENLVPPSSVGGGGGAKEDGDQVLDVRDPDGLKVEVGDHGVIRATRGSTTWLEWSRRRRLLRQGDALPCRRMEEALRLGDVASKSVSSGTLVLPGEGGHTHVLLGGGCHGLGVLQATARALSAAATVEGAETSHGGRRWRRKVQSPEVHRRGDRGGQAGRCHPAPAPTTPIPPPREVPPLGGIPVEAGVVAAETVVSGLLIVATVEGPGREVARTTAASEQPRPPKMRRAAAIVSGPSAATAAAVAGQIP